MVLAASNSAVSDRTRELVSLRAECRVLMFGRWALRSWRPGKYFGRRLTRLEPTPRREVPLFALGTAARIDRIRLMYQRDASSAPTAGSFGSHARGEAQGLEASVDPLPRAFRFPVEGPELADPGCPRSGEHVRAASELAADVILAIPRQQSRRHRRRPTPHVGMW